MSRKGTKSTENAKTNKGYEYSLCPLFAPCLCG